MALNGHFALCFKIHAFSEPTTKISVKIDPCCLWQRCSARTVFLVMLGLCGYSKGFLVDEASNDSSVTENVDFKGFRTLRLRHLRKWSQHFYIVVFSPLSLFHWSENTWPFWMTHQNGHFTLNFHYYEQPFKKLFLHTYSSVSLYHVTSADVRKRADSDPQNIWDPRKKLRIFHRR